MIEVMSHQFLSILITPNRQYLELTIIYLEIYTWIEAHHHKLKQSIVNLNTVFQLMTSFRLWAGYESIPIYLAEKSWLKFIVTWHRR